jgi:hypothetical protein
VDPEEEFFYSASQVGKLSQRLESVNGTTYQTIYQNFELAVHFRMKQLSILCLICIDTQDVVARS